MFIEGLPRPVKTAIRVGTIVVVVSVGGGLSISSSHLDNWSSIPPQDVTLELTLKPTVAPIPSPSITQSSLPTQEPTPSATTIPEQTPIPKTYSKNLYDRSSVLYQNTDRNTTDWTACVPASTEMMLNFISKKGDRGTGFKWKPTNSYGTQEKILLWERAHDTRLKTPDLDGTDAHGWRNGLNEYGWGIYTNPDEMVYEDEAFDSYAEALKAIVRAIALYNKPVGILAWHGNHAQIITGYEVQGKDPAVSSDFTVKYIYLTDPLKPPKGKVGLRNARISYSAFQNGYGTFTDPSKNRFLPFDTNNGSPNDDPYTPGETPSDDEWLGKWVIVAPVR